MGRETGKGSENGPGNGKWDRIGAGQKGRLWGQVKGSGNGSGNRKWNTKREKGWETGM